MNIEPIPPQDTYPRIPVGEVLDTHPDPNLSLSKVALEGIRRRKEQMKKEGKGFGAQVLDLEQPSYTIPARYYKDGYDALVPTEAGLRRLSEDELKRIQTFPESFIFCGSRRERIIQIGNAVAPRFAYHLAKHVQDVLSSKDAWSHKTLTELRQLCKIQREQAEDKGKFTGYYRMSKEQLIQLLNKH